MKDIKPSGWLIDDGGAWQFTTKTDDVVTAKRFNWKVTPLYSEQSLADIRAEAITQFTEHVKYTFEGIMSDDALIDFGNEYIANRIKEG